MAKTLEELKEAIDNIIVENDKGEITASALNMLLHDMSDTLSELGGSGGGQFDIYATLTYNEDQTSSDDPLFFITTTEEQKELNKIVFDKIANGERCPLVIHVNDVEQNPVGSESMNVSSTCIYLFFARNLTEDIYPEAGMVKGSTFYQFMCYGLMMFGGEVLTATEDGDIKMIV